MPLPSLSDDTTLDLDPIDYFNGFVPLYASFMAHGLLGDPRRLFQEISNRCAAVSAILDVGVGTGESAKPFISAGHKVSGIDGSPAMLAHCRTKRVLSHEQLHLVDLASQAFPLPAGHFDAVISNQTLYFLEDPRHALNEMNRVTKPGGLIAFNYRAAKGNETQTDINNATGYDGSRQKAEVKTYRHPRSLVESFAAQNQLSLLGSNTYIGYEKLDGTSVDFTLCLYQKPSL